jgi:hypothetical protein
MKLGDTPISVSLATIELKPEVAGTRVTVTEHGTNWLMDRLGENARMALLDPAFRAGWGRSDRLVKAGPCTTFYSVLQSTPQLKELWL